MVYYALVSLPKKLSQTFVLILHLSVSELVLEHISSLMAPLSARYVTSLKITSLKIIVAYAKMVLMI